MNAKLLHIIAFSLVIVGAINWGLTALNYNVVEMILGTGTLSMVVYLLVGASGVYIVATHQKDCKVCGKK